MVDACTRLNGEKCWPLKLMEGWECEFVSFNRSMIFRRWRFFHSPDLVWVRVVKVIYGSDRG